MLKRAALFAVFLLLLPSCSLWKNAPKGWSGATGGEQLERLFWDEIKAKNWPELQKHLAPLFVANSPDATRDQAAAIENWKRYDLQSVSLAEVQVHTAGVDFVVTSTVTLAGTIDGKPIPPQPVRSMTVWQQVSKGWVVIAHSDSLP